uniref:Uncharacterized protein n=1 Tax=Rhizophora mucronata TaxID=61149 RepID=A0A2P2PW65_RHIMU
MPLPPVMWSGGRVIGLLVLVTRLKSCYQWITWLDAIAFALDFEGVFKFASHSSYPF